MSTVMVPNSPPMFSLCAGDMWASRSSSTRRAPAAQLRDGEFGRYVFLTAIYDQLKRDELYLLAALGVLVVVLIGRRLWHRTRWRRAT